jgi:hypothetical protein
VVHKVRFSLDNGTTTAFSTSEEGPIGPGETHTVEADTLWTTKLGSHTLEAFVDSPGVIPEANESNNRLTTTISVDPNDKVNARIAYGGSSSLVVWQDSRNGNQDIYGARVDASGHVLDKTGIAISKAVGDQTDPSVAWNGSSYLVAWSDGRAVGSKNIFSTRVLADGTVVSKNGVSITTAVDDQLYPSVRASGSTWLVVWQDAQSGAGTDIYGARVASTGSRIGAPFAISTAERDQRRPSVAAGTSGWFVVWGDRRPVADDDTVTPSNDSDIYGSRVATDGTVANPGGIAISTAAHDQANPSIAWNGSLFLVVWSDYRSGTSLDIYGSRVGAAGGVQNPGGIAIANTAKREAAPALSALGSTFLVTWQAQPASGGTWDVLGTRVSATGVVSDPTGKVIAGGGNDQTSPAVGVSGSNFLVAWSERRKTSVDLLGARVTTAGAIVSPGVFSISPTAAK